MSLQLYKDLKYNPPAPQSKIRLSLSRNQQTEGRVLTKWTQRKEENGPCKGSVEDELFILQHHK